MFEDIRKQHKLTRQEVAEATKRSVNYILKAEQATFPSAPVALVQYYVDNYGYDAVYLREAYRDYQRRQRRAWLNSWTPKDYTAGIPFRFKWVKLRPQWHTLDVWAENAAVGAFPSDVDVYSSSYGISVGLCIPAAVVYRNDKDLSKAGAIRDAMGDILEFVLSGEANAVDFAFDYELVNNLRRIALEEGVSLSERAA